MRAIKQSFGVQNSQGGKSLLLKEILVIESLIHVSESTSLEIFLISIVSESESFAGYASHTQLC